MRANPRAAAPLVEDGSVAAWFEANGWTYPVIGPAVRGIGSVQQFFEAMGLARPPMMVLSQSEVTLEATSAQPIRGSVVLRTPEKKWVYAEVRSDVAWLRPLAPIFSGPLQTTIGFEIDPAQPRRGRRDRPAPTPRQWPNADVRPCNRDKTANNPASAAFAPKRPAKAKSVKGTSVASADAESSVLRALAIGAGCGLALRLLLMLPGDFFARMTTAATDGPATGTLAFWLASPLASDEEGFLSRFILATFWLGMVGCVAVTWKQRQSLRDLFYPLMCRRDGRRRDRGNVRVSTRSLRRLAASPSWSCCRRRPRHRRRLSPGCCSHLCVGPFQAH